MLVYVCCVQLLQSCPTLCHPVDCGLPGSSVHGIFQARILEWVAKPSSGGSSQPRGQTLISCITGRFFTAEALGKPQLMPTENQQFWHWEGLYKSLILKSSFN